MRSFWALPLTTVLLRSAGVLVTTHSTGSPVVRGAHCASCPQRPFSITTASHLMSASGSGSHRPLAHSAPMVQTWSLLFVHVLCSNSHGFVSPDPGGTQSAPQFGLLPQSPAGTGGTTPPQRNSIWSGQCAWSVHGFPSFVPPTQTLTMDGHPAFPSHGNPLLGPPTQVPLHTLSPLATQVATFSHTWSHFSR